MKKRRGRPLSALPKSVIEEARGSWGRELSERELLAEALTRMKTLKAMGLSDEEAAKQMGFKSRQWFHTFWKRHRLRLNEAQRRMQRLFLFVRAHKPVFEGKRLSALELNRHIRQNLHRPISRVSRELGVSLPAYTLLLEHIGLLGVQRALRRNYKQPLRHKGKAASFERAVRGLRKLAEAEGVGPEKLTLPFVQQKKGVIAVHASRAGVSFKDVFEAAFPEFRYVAGRGRHRTVIVRREKE
jgi:hypothetical protein